MRARMRHRKHKKLETEKIDVIIKKSQDLQSH